MRVWPHLCTGCSSWLSPESASSVSSKGTCLIHGTRQAVCLYSGGRPRLAPEHKHLRSQSPGRDSKVSRAAQTTRASLIPPHNATHMPLPPPDPSLSGEGPARLHSCSGRPVPLPLGPPCPHPPALLLLSLSFCVQLISTPTLPLNPARNQQSLPF